MAPCLAAAWCTASLATAQRHVSGVLGALGEALAVAAKQADQVAVAAAATRCAEHCAALDAEASAAAGEAPGGWLAVGRLVGL